MEQQNSNNQISSNRNWLSIWSISILIAALFVCIHEYILTSAGYKPSLVSDEALWSVMREKIDSSKQNSLLLLGSSRMQTNVDTRYLRDTCNVKQVIQLALSGRGTSYPVFRDIVENTDYKGQILISETEATLSSNKSEQESFVKYFHSNFTIDRKINRKIRTWLQQKILIANPANSSKRLWGNLLIKHRLPPPYHVTTLPTRDQLADFSLVDFEKLRIDKLDGITEQYKGSRFINNGKWLENVLAKWGPLITKFRDRGGEVAFIRMPIDPERWVIEGKYWPIERYWQRFLISTNTTGVHFETVPEFNQLTYPDGSHIDRKDRIKFTNIMLGALSYGIDREKRFSKQGDHMCKFSANNGYMHAMLPVP